MEKTSLLPAVLFAVAFIFFLFLQPGVAYAKPDGVKPKVPIAPANKKQGATSNIEMTVVRKLQGGFLNLSGDYYLLKSGDIFFLDCQQGYRPKGGGLYEFTAGIFQGDANLQDETYKVVEENWSAKNRKPKFAFRFKDYEQCFKFRDSCVLNNDASVTLSIASGKSDSNSASVIKRYVCQNRSQQLPVQGQGQIGGKQAF